MKEQLQSAVQAMGLYRDAIVEQTSEIFERVLRDSAFLDGANFTVFHPQNLRRMFDLYDRFFSCRFYVKEKSSSQPCRYLRWIISSASGTPVALSD